MNIFSGILFLFSVLFFFCQPASSSDTVDREIIGFSSDGGLFAFEQYGVSGGTGIAWSQIFIVNTNTGLQVKGSPYSVRPGESTAPRLAKLEHVRKKARKMAESALRPVILNKNSSRSTIIASTHRVDEKFANPYRVSVYLARAPHFIMFNSATRNSTMEFELELIDFSSKLQTLPASVPSYCADLIENYRPTGFRLLRIIHKDGSQNTTQKPVVMHEDKTIPKEHLSRCPVDYKPSDVIFYTYQDKKINKQKYVVAVLVRMKIPGFEGLSRRYVAVTEKLN